MMGCCCCPKPQLVPPHFIAKCHENDGPVRWVVDYGIDWGTSSASVWKSCVAIAESGSTLCLAVTAASQTTTKLMFVDRLTGHIIHDGKIVDYPSFLNLVGTFGLSTLSDGRFCCWYLKNGASPNTLKVHIYSVRGAEQYVGEYAFTSTIDTPRLDKSNVIWTQDRATALKDLCAFPLSGLASGDSLTPIRSAVSTHWHQMLSAHPFADRITDQETAFVTNDFDSLGILNNGSAYGLMNLEGVQVWKLVVSSGAIVITPITSSADIYAYLNENPWEQTFTLNGDIGQPTTDYGMPFKNGTYLPSHQLWFFNTAVSTGESSVSVHSPGGLFEDGDLTTIDLDYYQQLVDWDVDGVHLNYTSPGPAELEITPSDEYQVQDLSVSWHKSDNVVLKSQYQIPPLSQQNRKHDIRLYSMTLVGTQVMYEAIGMNCTTQVVNHNGTSFYYYDDDDFFTLLKPYAPDDWEGYGIQRRITQPIPIDGNAYQPDEDYGGCLLFSQTGDSGSVLTPPMSHDDRAEAFWPAALGYRRDDPDPFDPETPPAVSHPTILTGSYADENGSYGQNSFAIHVGSVWSKRGPTQGSPLNSLFVSWHRALLAGVDTINPADIALPSTALSSGDVTPDLPTWGYTGQVNEIHSGLVSYTTGMLTYYWWVDAVEWRHILPTDEVQDTFRISVEGMLQQYPNNATLATNLHASQDGSRNGSSKAFRFGADFSLQFSGTNQDAAGNVIPETPPAEIPPTSRYRRRDLWYTWDAVYPSHYVYFLLGTAPADDYEVAIINLAHDGNGGYLFQTNNVTTYTETSPGVWSSSTTTGRYVEWGTVTTGDDVSIQGQQLPNLMAITTQTKLNSGLVFQILASSGSTLVGGVATDHSVPGLPAGSWYLLHFDRAIKDVDWITIWDDSGTKAAKAIVDTAGRPVWFGERVAVGSSNHRGYWI